MSTSYLEGEVDSSVGLYRDEQSSASTDFTASMGSRITRPNSSIQPTRSPTRRHVLYVAKSVRQSIALYGGG